MKRMFNRKKRPSNRKKGLNKVKRIFKTIKKKRIEIESPYNSSQFLIENGSSPFYDEEDDDIDISYIPNPLICLKENEDIKICSELDIRHFSSNSTQSEYRFEAQIWRRTENCIKDKCTGKFIFRIKLAINIINKKKENILDLSKNKKSFNYIFINNN